VYIPSFGSKLKVLVSGNADEFCGHLDCEKNDNETCCRSHGVEVHQGARLLEKKMPSKS
jgi:hypothetical protein